MKTLINNFCDGSPILLEHVNHATCGSLVRICQEGGSISFHHSLRPDQAREMAAALIAHADAVEKELQDAQNIV